jgi:signal transduction histidine kinase
MSHELCTPLNAILAYAQLPQGGWRAPAEEPRHHRAGRAASVGADRRRASTWRASNPETRAASPTVQLVVFLRTVANISRVRAEQKQLRFSTRCPGLPCAVQPDERRLRHVLLNLSGDAVSSPTTAWWS